MSFVRLPKKRARPPMGVRSEQRTFYRHQRYVRSLECICANIQPDGKRRIACHGSVQFCHVRSSMDAGHAQKPHDWFSYPGCFAHHRQQSDAGERAFESIYGLDLIGVALGLARQSPDTAMRAAMREAGFS